MNICKHCGWQIDSESVNNFTVWVDNTGGDVCGWGGGNEPHEPHTTLNGGGKPQEGN